MKASNGFETAAACASLTSNGTITMYQTWNCTFHDDTKEHVEGDIACRVRKVNGHYLIWATETIDSKEHWDMLVKLAEYCESEITGDFTGYAGEAYKEYNKNLT